MLAGGEISAALVKQLRQSSGAGMMDCKKALAEASGNLEVAAEVSRALLVLQRGVDSCPLQPCTQYVVCCSGQG